MLFLYNLIFTNDLHDCLLKQDKVIVAHKGYKLFVENVHDLTLRDDKRFVSSDYNCECTIATPRNLHRELFHTQRSKSNGGKRSQTRSVIFVFSTVEIRISLRLGHSWRHARVSKLFAIKFWNGPTSHNL